MNLSSWWNIFCSDSIVFYFRFSHNVTSVGVAEHHNNPLPSGDGGSQEKGSEDGAAPLDNVRMNPQCFLLSGVPLQF